MNQPIENDILMKLLNETQDASETKPPALFDKMPVGTPVREPDPTMAPNPSPSLQTASPLQPSVFQGFTPKYAMEGFAFDREQNTGKSAKDAFAYLANQAPPPPLNDKAALEAWTNQYIVPGMNALGHNISGVQGDKFKLKNWQGEFDVDYGRGAGADGGALAWQVDDGTAQLSTGAYTPQGAPTVSPLEKGPSSIDRILAEVQALQGGGASPLEQEALMELLRV